MAKKKIKMAKMVAVRSANCATIDLLIQSGMTISVGKKTIVSNGIRYDKPKEIDIYIRDGILVPMKSKEGKNAVAKAAGKITKKDTTKKVRGMEVEEEEAYMETPIPSRKSKKLVADVSDDELEEIEEDMEVAIQDISKHKIGKPSKNVRYVEPGVASGEMTKAQKQMVNAK